MDPTAPPRWLLPPPPGLLGSCRQAEGRSLLLHTARRPVLLATPQLPHLSRVCSTLKGIQSHPQKRGSSCLRFHLVSHRAQPPTDVKLTTFSLQLFEKTGGHCGRATGARALPSRLCLLKGKKGCSWINAQVQRPLRQRAQRKNNKFVVKGTSLLTAGYLEWFLQIFPHDKLDSFIWWGGGSDFRLNSKVVTFEAEKMAKQWVFRMA